MSEQEEAAGKKQEGEVEKKFHWPPLESNPEIMTEYLHKIGLSPSFGIGEVYGFDEDLLAFLPQPIYGIIVAFERLNRNNDITKGDKDNVGFVDFYMDQSGTLDNACGIIACIHAILNNKSSVDIVPDSVLDKFAKENENKTPAERCKSLEENNGFRETHTKFANKGQSATITNAKDQKKVKHHYVAFVVKHGKLIELDGTKQGPNIIEGDCHDVLRGTISEIQKRLANGEISESLSMMTLNVAA